MDKSPYYYSKRLPWMRVEQILGSYPSRHKTGNTTHQIMNLIMARIFVMKEKFENTNK